MAERRMFAKSIIDSDAFLDMSLSTQALYFHLCMRADDDGFINNAKKIIRMIGAGDDEIKILLAKKFLIAFETGVIVIKHWRIHNYIRSDRYKPTNYPHEFTKLSIDSNNSYSLGVNGIPNDNHMDTSRIPNGNPGKVRLELGKDIDTSNEVSLSGNPDDTNPKSYPYAEIVNYLNQKTGSNYQSTCKKTRELIRARFADGHDVDAFKRAVDNQVALWWHDFKFRQYLRPDTLFGPKMDSYANANVTPEQIAVAQGKVGVAIARGMEEGTFNIKDMF
ncbi:conserved phage C-terminal domain-containing protein [Fastidiosibacter lacustris]|uniref:conserved phage C-terminal domain-containing protein n=1 Tax=Fastidiosibacter lacustris TaxID=2056695 RepID=UPI000E34CC8D|nr:conserved phage C-terminal domain-containing protein [Fastidiosibacter lacustris]